MGALQRQAVWSNAESVVIPVVTRLFRGGDEIPGFEKDSTFRYAGVRDYVGRTGRFAKLHTRVILVASLKGAKSPARLFPVAIGPMLSRLASEPARFTETSLTEAVQETLTLAGLPEGELPGFYTNESYYFAFCREMLLRLERPAEPAFVTDERGVAWIRGTQVKVLEVVASHLAHGWSAEEILRQHPGLELPSIYAALAWYYAHRAACDEALAAQLEIAERLRAEQGDTPLRARLRRAGRAA